MFLYNKKDLEHISREANNLADEITEFAEGIVSILKESDRDIEYKVTVARDLINSIKSNLDVSDSPFSDKIKDRIRRTVEDCQMSLEEDIELLTREMDLDTDNILSERSNYRDSEDYLTSVNFYRSIEIFDSNNDDRINLLEKIDNFLSNPKIKKQHFVIERRAGLVAIKDRKHSDYKVNRREEVSINNGEVYFIADGIWDSVNGWSVPDTLIERCKETCRKLNFL